MQASKGFIFFGFKSLTVFCRLSYSYAENYKRLPGTVNILNSFLKKNGSYVSEGRYFLRNFVWVDKMIDGLSHRIFGDY